MIPTMACDPGQAQYLPAQLPAGPSPASPRRPSPVAKSLGNEQPPTRAGSKPPHNPGFPRDPARPEQCEQEIDSDDGSRWGGLLAQPWTLPRPVDKSR